MTRVVGSEREGDGQVSSLARRTLEELDRNRNEWTTLAPTSDPRRRGTGRVGSGSETTGLAGCEISMTLPPNKSHNQKDGRGWQRRMMGNGTPQGRRTTQEAPSSVHHAKWAGRGRPGRATNGDAGWAWQPVKPKNWRAADRHQSTSRSLTVHPWRALIKGHWGPRAERTI
jgi:hypothetical protein